MNRAFKLSEQPSVCAEAADASIHVCSLTEVHDVLENTRARFLVSAINEQLMLATPHKLEAENHLKLAFNDIAVPKQGLIAPSSTHVERLVEIGRAHV